MRIARSGDVRIAYELAGAGDPILLIQGLGYARWGWEPVAERLVDDFLVIGFDNRGIGESDTPRGPYTVAELAGDAVAVLDAAGLERAHVIGASLGGMIAQELAIAHPERVRKLVLVCTTPGGAAAYPMPKPTVRLFAEAVTLPLEEAVRRLVENALTVRGRLVDDLVARRLAAPLDPEGWRAQVAAAMSWSADGRLGAIRAPTLVVHGTADNVVDHRNAQLLADRIPDARIALLPGAGHLLFWEQPDEFVRTVRDFLA